MLIHFRLNLSMFDKNPAPMNSLYLPRLSGGHEHTDNDKNTNNSNNDNDNNDNNSNITITIIMIKINIYKNIYININLPTVTRTLPPAAASLRRLYSCYRHVHPTTDMV